MSAIDDIGEVLEQNPDNFVFAAKRSEHGVVTMPDHGNYLGEAHCVGMLILTISKQTGASAERVATDALAMAKENEDSPMIEFMGGDQ